MDVLKYFIKTKDKDTKNSEQTWKSNAVLGQLNAIVPPENWLSTLNRDYYMIITDIWGLTAIASLSF